MNNRKEDFFLFFIFQFTFLGGLNACWGGGGGGPIPFNNGGGGGGGNNTPFGGGGGGGGGAGVFVPFESAEVDDNIDFWNIKTFLIKL